MSRPRLPENDRILDLLTSRATEGLSGDEERELGTLARDHPGFDHDAFDLAAAAIELALSRPESDAKPPDLRGRIEADAPRSVVAGHPSSAPEHGDQAAARTLRDFALRRSPSSRFIQGAGWLVAAACLLAAVAGWWPRLVTKAAAPRPTIEEQRQDLLGRPGAVRAEWTEWDGPEIKGVRGDVVWCPASQKGFVRFLGLPRNDPAEQQYQLWLMEGREPAEPAVWSVTVGVFDGGPGEIIVPIEAPVRVGGVVLFGVTIEKPGGTWASDMKRRVVVAAIKG